jgi:class 3 adenylate cyclase
MRDLPTGRVTFLLTDIEGSTGLLHALADRYAEVLADHRRLLRTAFARHSGVEVDTQGDSFFVAFVDAGEALAAAEESQRALRAMPGRATRRSMFAWASTPASLSLQTITTSGSTSIGRRA